MIEPVFDYNSDSTVSLSQANSTPETKVTTMGKAPSYQAAAPGKDPESSFAKLTFDDEGTRLASFSGAGPEMAAVSNVMAKKDKEAGAGRGFEEGTKAAVMPWKLF